MILVAGALAFRLSAIRAIILKNRVLVAALLGLILYAVSSKVYLGNWFMVNLRYEKNDILKEFTRVFRSSGRFFWPVGYIIVIGTIAVLVRGLRQRHAMCLILVAVGIQAFDIAPLMRRVANAAIPRDAIDIEMWTEAARAYDGFTIYPTYHCTLPHQRDKILQLQLVAARAGIPSNGAYTNRAQTDCPGARIRIIDNLFAEAVSPNSLVIALKDSVPLQALQGKAKDGLTCREGRFAFVCGLQDKTNNAAFIALGPEFKMPKTPLGKKLSVQERGKGFRFLGYGWSESVGLSRWATGPVTSIYIHPSSPICGTFVFEAMVTPFTSEDYRVQTAKVILNGKDSGRIDLSHASKQVVRSAIPLEGQCLKEAILELHFEGLRSPRELGLSWDTRKLSWQFDWFSVGGS
ncbi:hypothetical protein AB4Y85_12390 [Microvirga sp. 2YAF29]|uniref:hypothetical protein n=1 Tax=Microvirga sp. 2YAF29 TaxID=3233031 RepID=UPI003F9B83FD